MASYNNFICCLSKHLFVCITETMKRLMDQIGVLEKHNRQTLQRLNLLETENHHILNRLSSLENNQYDCFQYDDFQEFEMASPYANMSPIQYSSKTLSPNTTIMDGMDMNLSSTGVSTCISTSFITTPICTTASMTTMTPATSSVTSNYMSSIMAAKENNPLPLIDLDKMLRPQHVVDKYPKLLTASKLPTLAVCLAKQAYFGKQVMICYTVRGTGKFHALPQLSWPI